MNTIMKAIVTIALVMFLYIDLTATGTNINNLNTEVVYFSPDTIGVGEELINNPGFESWTDGLPDNWKEINDRIGKVSNNVTVTPETYIRSGGTFSAKVQSVEPFGGISHPVNQKMPVSWSVYPVKGRAAVHLAKENGTSAFFGEYSLVQDDFELPYSPGKSSAIRNAHALRLDNGDYIELFSVCSTSETSYQGAVYMKRNGGNPELFLDFENHRTWAWPGVMDIDSKYVFVSMRTGSDKQTHLYATDISRDFRIVSNDRLLYNMDSTNVQCYSMLKHIDGTIIMPIVYAGTHKVAKGPWYLDILTTKDFSEVVRLNAPHTYPGRGLMEAYPVMLSDGTVAILCRTDQGHLAKAIYNPVTKLLSPAVATNIAQPSAGSYARNLSDNSILLSWLANLDLRKVLVMAVSEDDMATWQSYHVIMTSDAMGISMTASLPYIHQPFVYEDAEGSLICYYEEVISPSEINLYKTNASGYRINNVANSPNEWHQLIVDKTDNAAFVQLVNVVDPYGTAFFDQTTITDAIISLNTGLKIYPNPLAEILYISSDKPVTAVEIMDLNGKLVSNYTGLTEIPVNDLTEGMYLIKVTQGSEVVIFKVVKTS